MNNPKGTIHSLVTGPQGLRALVDVDVDAACPRCAAGKGCGAGILAGNTRIRRVEASVSGELSVTAGDEVEVALESANLLQAALLVYGIPLVGGILFAGLAYLFALGDLVAALAALCGLALGFACSRWRLRDTDCMQKLVPRVERRLSSRQRHA